ncbi:MAG: hypothetical protein FJ134_04545 [Deltaproteobacteria bacterium]|nr:hypothetical protein [Deltaproteobacteria bacterium]
MLVIISKNKLDALIDAAIGTLEELHCFLYYERKEEAEFEMDLERVETELRLAISDITGMKL